MVSRRKQRWFGKDFRTSLVAATVPRDDSDSRYVDIAAVHRRWSLAKQMRQPIG